MTDVRALLKAKRQETRITHSLATYTFSGQLRCVACESSVRDASAWEGHIGSKAHRTNAARLKEQRAREAQREAVEQENLKRKAMEVDDEEAEPNDDGMDEDMPSVPPKKRRVESEERVPSTTAAMFKPKTKRNALPAGFFSDPTMAPTLPEDDGDVEEEGEGGAAAAPANELDTEWQAFQQSVIDAPDYRETYERATVMADPVVSAELPQGFPQTAAAEELGQTAGAPEKEEELDEEGRRRKKEQEERELIMDRLMEEEQAQEEADERVLVLKSKLEALKKRREAALAKKSARMS